MEALHLPGIPDGETPPYSFPAHPPLPSALQYTPTSFPLPASPTSLVQPAYLISVTHTALTRGELTWSETLSRSRFHPYGSAIPGHDVVGTITRAYPATISPFRSPKFKPGDLVWGLIDFDRDGACATSTIAYESEIALAPPCPPSTSPATWSMALATLPLSGLTAYQALFTHAQLTPPLTQNTNTTPPKVLITGASGSVGVLTSQLAHASGAHVIALASTSKQALLVPYIDTFIAYDDPAYTSLPTYMSTHGITAIDVVVDCVGGDVLSSIVESRDSESSAIFKKDATIITITAPHPGTQFFIVKPSSPQLEELGKFVLAGKLTGFVDAAYDLKDGKKAMEKVEGRVGSRGKVVVKIGGV